MSRLGLSQIAFASALMIGFAGAVKADETYNILPQGRAVTTALGNNASAVTYWADEADGVRVFTTINVAGGSETTFDSQQPALVRFSALILPGQSQVIAIQGPAGSQRQALRIRRLSNRSGGFRIEVDRIADPRPTVY